MDGTRSIKKEKGQHSALAPPRNTPRGLPTKQQAKAGNIILVTEFASHSLLL